MILHKSVRLHLSSYLFIVYHHHDCENYRKETNIFFRNIFLNASAEATCTNEDYRAAALITYNQWYKVVQTVNRNRRKVDDQCEMAEAKRGAHNVKRDRGVI